jgi:DNA-directed RNA polymerase specialized sigma24 family protein
VSALRDLRQRRADAMLRRDYRALRAHVIGTVAGHLRRKSIFFDEGDLDAHYNIAWQGLYSELLAGKDVSNPTGWLVKAVIRDAYDDGRRLTTQKRAVNFEVREETISEVGRDSDIADKIDDHTKLSQFQHGLKSRLSQREYQAATLCYIHGFSRPEAAKILGVEPKRMEKIMDAVSKKIGDFTREIELGSWCEAQRSLMNAFALNVLDRDAERYGLARDHLEQCPACRRYVRSMRGIAAILPPVALPLKTLGASAAAGGMLETLHGVLDGAARQSGAPAGGAATTATTSGSAITGASALSSMGGVLGVKTAVTVAILAIGGGAVAMGLVTPSSGRDEPEATVREAGPTNPALPSVTTISLPTSAQSRGPTRQRGRAAHRKASTKKSHKANAKTDTRAAKTRTSPGSTSSATTTPAPTTTGAPSSAGSSSSGSSTQSSSSSSSSSGAELGLEG